MLKLRTLIIATGIALSAVATPNASAASCVGGANIGINTDGTVLTAGSPVNYTIVGCNDSIGDRFTAQPITASRNASGALIESAAAPLTTVSRNRATGTFTASGSFTPTAAGRYVIRSYYYAEGQAAHEMKAEAILRIEEPIKPVGDPVPTPTPTPVPNPVVDPVGEPTPVRAIIALTKRSVKRTVKAGKAAKFTLTVKNAGKVTSKNVIVCDALPKRTQYLSSSAKVTFTNGKACVKAGDLKVGQSSKFTLTLRVDANAPAGRIINTATATSDNADTVKAADYVKVTKVIHRVKAPVTG